MAMAAPHKPRARSRAAAIAPLRRASSLANSAAATAPARSRAPCCARSTPRSRLKLGSAHHLVGYFPRPTHFVERGPSTVAARKQYRPFLPLGFVPFVFPPVKWDVLWLTGIRALGSLWAGSCAPHKPSPSAARAGWSETSGHERAGPAAGNRRLLSSQWPCGIDLRPARRQRRQAHSAA